MATSGHSLIKTRIASDPVNVSAVVRADGNLTALDQQRQRSRVSKANARANNISKTIIFLLLFNRWIAENRAVVDCLYLDSSGDRTAPCSTWFVVLCWCPLD